MLEKSVRISTSMPTKVSICIPVYGVERYIERCARSLFEQTYENIEYIFIDDCTPDNSIRILKKVIDDYPDRKESVRIIRHEYNKGLAIARTTAVANATGEFVIHVDSDDWIELTMVEKMLFMAIDNDFDVVWCDTMIHKQEKKYIYHLKFDNNPKEMLKSIYQGKIHGWFWNKLIRRSFLEDFIAYKESMLEDVFFSTQLLLKPLRMGYISEPLYNYNCKNRESLTASCDSYDSIMIESIPNIRHCYEHLVYKHCWDEFKEAFSIRIFHVKIALVKSNRYIEAQSFCSFVNSNIKIYPINFPYSIVYWLGLNLGLFGRIILRMYFFKRYLHLRIKR